MQAKGPRRASWPSPKTYENSSVRLGGAGEAELLQIQRVRGIHELGGGIGTPVPPKTNAVPSPSGESAVSTSCIART